MTGVRAFVPRLLGLMLLGLLLPGALLLFGAGPAAAQGLPGATPETEMAAQELLQSMHVDAQMAAVLTAMRGQMVSMLERGAKPGTDVAGLVDQVILPEMKARVGELASAIGAVWASQLSVEDLHAMRDFYASEPGKRLLAAQATIAAQSFAVGRMWGERVGREAILKHADELRKRGVTL